MHFPLNPKHWKQYRDVALLLVKHGRSDLVKMTGLRRVMPRDWLPESAPLPAQAISLADDLEKMGPTFIKMGQLLSTRTDLLPAAYIDALARLQDKVEPFPVGEVERIIADELGVRLSKAFARFDPVPLAAASLGQVHRASLRDGLEVVVKVQRPGIEEKIIDDLDALREVAQFLDHSTGIGRKYEFTATTDELRRCLLDELDYREEARNLLRLADDLRSFRRLVIPRPFDDFTSRRVLTMEFIKGKKITGMSPLRRMEIDAYGLADELFGSYLSQIFVAGFFHADPHPGNVFLTDDNRVALLDLGMTSRVNPELQDRLLQLLLAIGEGRSSAAARLAFIIGQPRPGVDEGQFLRRVADWVSRHRDARIGKMNVGRTILEIKRIAGDCQVSVPPELSMIGKALLNLDQIGTALAPEFNPNESVRRYASKIAWSRLVGSISAGGVYSGALGFKELVQHLPGRLRTIVDRLSRNEIEFKIDAIDERLLIEGFQKVANRIAVGLILASLIVGAALLMRIPTSFTLFGYPGLAMIFFLLAAGGGIALVIDVFLHDRRRRKR